MFLGDIDEIRNFKGFFSLQFSFRCKIKVVVPSGAGFEYLKSDDDF